MTTYKCSECKQKFEDYSLLVAHFSHALRKAWRIRPDKRKS
jgi:hypothetical protein